MKRKRKQGKLNKLLKPHLISKSHISLNSYPDSIKNIIFNQFDIGRKY